MMNCGESLNCSRLVKYGTVDSENKYQICVVTLNRHNVCNELLNFILQTFKHANVKV